jgi:hypothetical protein
LQEKCNKTHHFCTVKDKLSILLSYVVTSKG